jgi:hypothetical protein
LALHSSSKAKPACGDGFTSFKFAIDIVALLRGVGTAQYALFCATALPCTVLDCMHMLLLLPLPPLLLLPMAIAKYMKFTATKLQQGLQCQSS